MATGKLPTKNTITISLTHYQELVEGIARAEHLQKEIYQVDELHYDECEKLNTEIAILKQRLLIRGVN